MVRKLPATATPPDEFVSGSNVKGCHPASGDTLDGPGAQICVASSGRRKRVRKPAKVNPSRNEDQNTLERRILQPPATQSYTGSASFLD
jgi:hypothetical protein